MCVFVFFFRIIRYVYIYNIYFFLFLGVIHKRSSPSDSNTNNTNSERIVQESTKPLLQDSRHTYGSINGQDIENIEPSSSVSVKF